MSTLINEHVDENTTTASSGGLREGAFGNARTLVCRECSHEVALGPSYACPECFGPLEVAYDFPAVTREQIEAGPRNIWRYKALLPVPTDIEESPNTEPGFTRLLRAHNLGDKLGNHRGRILPALTIPAFERSAQLGACQFAGQRQPLYKVRWYLQPGVGERAIHGAE